MRRYAPEQVEFVKRNFPGRSNADMARLFEKKFGMRMTARQMHSFTTRHKLKNGLYGRGAKKYTPRMEDWLRKNVKGRQFNELAELFNARFGASFTRLAIKDKCQLLGLHNGVVKRWEKGHVPPNKGMKGCYAGSEKSWIRPGHPCYRAKEIPLGGEKIDSSGYVRVKVRMKGPPARRWKSKASIVWEAANGPVPKGHVISYADGDRQNCALGNLMLVSRGEMGTMNIHSKRLGMAGKGNSMGALALAKLRCAVWHRKKETLKGGGSIVVIDNNGNRRYVARVRYGYRAVIEGPRGKRLAKLKTRRTAAAARRDLKEYAMKMGWRRE
jgi:hypothetical protein